MNRIEIPAVTQMAGRPDERRDVPRTQGGRGRGARIEAGPRRWTARWSR